MNRILLWIWRDLLISLLATGSKRDKERVPGFLEEIQDILGMNVLERILSGGRPSEFLDSYDSLLFISSCRRR